MKRIENQIIYLLLLYCAIVPIILLVQIVTSNLKSLDSFGDFGDAIGGVAGTPVALLGTILIYKALMAQLEANEIIKKEKSLNNKLLILSRLESLTSSKNMAKQLSHLKKIRPEEDLETISASINASQRVVFVMELMLEEIFEKHQTEENVFIKNIILSEYQELISLIIEISEQELQDHLYSKYSSYLKSVDKIKFHWNMLVKIKPMS